MLLDIGSKTFAVYAECARLYSRHDLGDHRDILAAFRGMSNLIGKEMGAPLHFGLPTSHFDLALLWSLHHLVSGVNLETRRSERPLAI